MSPGEARRSKICYYAQSFEKSLGCRCSSDSQYWPKTWPHQTVRDDVMTRTTDHVVCTFMFFIRLLRMSYWNFTLTDSSWECSRHGCFLTPTRDNGSNSIRSCSRKSEQFFFYLQKQHVAAQSIGEGQEVTDKGTEFKVSQFLK